MTDHHDYDDGWVHHDDDPGYVEELHQQPHEDLYAQHDDEPWWDDDPQPVHHDDTSWAADEHPAGDAGDTGDHLPGPEHHDDGGGGESLFPPTVDVGPLPEPVDGFPWIDTGSLGPVAAAAAEPGAPEPAELAGYAAADLPPAQDPWAALAASDDPATAALARFWRPETDGGAIPGQ